MPSSSIVHWEAGNTKGLVGPGWHPDPLDPARLRWWDGAAWVARIAKLEAGFDAISWRADFADLSPPAPQTAAPPVPIIDLTIEPPPPPLPIPASAELPISVPAEVALATSGPSRPHPRRNRRAWAALGVAVLVIGAGAGVGTAMLGSDERPTVAERIAYRSEDGAFALKYPDAWHLSKPNPDEEPVAPGEEIEFVSFIIGSTSVPTDEQNIVSVLARTTDGDPTLRLDDLVASTAADLAAKNLMNFRLVSATESRLAGAPAFRTEFVDTTSRPGVRLVGYTGRTASGLLLVVSITVREPRTQATDEELAELLASITSS